MTDKKGIIQLAQQFKQMEVRNRLFERKTTDGILYWDVVRYKIYMTILSHCGIYENIQVYVNKPQIQFWMKWVKAVKLLPLYLLNNLRFWLVLPRKKKFCFLLVSRFEDVEGNPEDLLLKDIYDQLKQDSFVIELFRHRAFRWYKRNIGPRFFLYGLELKYLFQKNRSDDWMQISDLINAEFNLGFDWSIIMNSALSTYRNDYHYFSELFKKIEPQFVFFQSEPKGMVAAANDLGIVTVDLQHGHTNNVDMMYSYPLGVNLKKVPTIPKYFFTLGKFWNTIVDSPSEMKVIGSNYFFVEPGKARNRKGILIVSSLFVHEYLKEATLKLAQHHADFHFYYKLHSNQAQQVETTIDFFDNCKNVDVVYTERNVTDIMEDCFAIALIQSSVTYQALQKGLKVYILKHDYYEASYDVFENKNVFLVNDWEHLSESLKMTKDTQKEVQNNCFYERFNPISLHEVICRKEIE